MLDIQYQYLISLRLSLHSVLKQEFQKSWANCPESYTNDIKLNPTQKDMKCS